MEIVVSKPMAFASMVAGISLVLGGASSVLLDGAPAFFWLLVLLGASLIVGGGVAYKRALAAEEAQYFPKQ